MVKDLENTRIMIGTTEKYYSRPIIVDAGQLRYLSEMVKERFGEVEYGIDTIDGNHYEYCSVDDLLAYKNPNSRKITAIRITGKKYIGGSLSVPELYLTIDDRSKSELSCFIKLKSLEESDIVYFKTRMDNFVKDYGVGYWWMYNPFFYWTFGACLYLLFAIILPWCVGKEFYVFISHNIVAKLCWSLACMAVAILLIKNGMWWLFPAGGFRIGDQIKVMDRRIKVRNRILGFIATVVSGLIVICLSR